MREYLQECLVTLLIISLKFSFVVRVSSEKCDKSLLVSVLVCWIWTINIIENNSKLGNTCVTQLLPSPLELVWPGQATRWCTSIFLTISSNSMEIFGYFHQEKNPPSRARKECVNIYLFIYFLFLIHFFLLRIPNFPL